MFPDWVIIYHSLTNMKHQRVDFGSRQRLMPHKHTHKRTQKCTLHYAFGNAPANTLVKEMDSKSEFLEKSILHSILESIRISVPTLNLLFHVGTV